MRAQDCTTHSRLRVCMCVYRMGVGEGHVELRGRGAADSIDNGRRHVAVFGRCVDPCAPPCKHSRQAMSLLECRRIPWRNAGTRGELRVFFAAISRGARVAYDQRELVGLSVDLNHDPR